MIPFPCCHTTLRLTYRPVVRKVVTFDSNEHSNKQVKSSMNGSEAVLEWASLALCAIPLAVRNMQFVSKHAGGRENRDE